MFEPPCYRWKMRAIVAALVVLTVGCESKESSVAPPSVPAVVERSGKDETADALTKLFATAGVKSAKVTYVDDVLIIHNDATCDLVALKNLRGILAKQGSDPAVHFAAFSCNGGRL